MSTSGGKSAWQRTWRAVRNLWKPSAPVDLEPQFAELRAQVPTPVFWLFGKTQSGKSSIVRYLTGADDAAIGNGFRPCTRTSRMFPFPSEDAPLLTFLDTRGVDEPGYEPDEDIAAFDAQAHLLLVTSRITDFAHGGVRDALTKIRKANPHRPVVLALTCLHEPHPQDQHSQPYPFDPLAVPVGQAPAVIGPAPDDVVRLIHEQTAQFEGLVDRVVPLDLTRPEEGYADPSYGGETLKRVLLDCLPGAYRTTFARVTTVNDALKDLHLKRAMPVILSYSTLAATAGGFPIPFVDLLILPAIQTKMIHALANLYGQPATATRFLEAATSLGLGLLARQAIREVVKFIPFVGAAAGAALAGASTYGLGRAFCQYYQDVHQGHVPDAAALKKLYHEQMGAAEKAWFKK